MLAMLEAILGKLNKKRVPLLAIDISSVCIKVLELSYNNGHFRVENYAVMALPAGVSEEKDTAVIAEMIHKTYLKSKSGAKHAAIAVADSSVITKVIQMEKGLSGDDMESQIAIEADKYIPYALEEVSLDFNVLEPSKNNPDLVNVLIVASRTENVDELVNLVEEAGLQVQLVDVESYAIERACSLLTAKLPADGKEQTIAVFDIGATSTNLTVLYDMTTIFTREEMFGGERLTRDIQRHYGLSYAEAGLAKKNGNLPDDYSSEILAPFIETAVIQVRRSLQFFYSASQQSEVNMILLAGGTVVIPGLADAIEKQIGIRTMIANPFVDMSVSRRVDSTLLEKDAASLMMSCGLAMRGCVE